MVGPPTGAIIVGWIGSSREGLTVRDYLARYYLSHFFILTPKKDIEFRF